MTNRSMNAQTNQLPDPVTAPSARRARKVAIEICLCRAPKSAYAMRPPSS